MRMGLCNEDLRKEDPVGPPKTAATTDVNVASSSKMAQHRPDGRTPSKQPTKRQEYDTGERKLQHKKLSLWRMRTRTGLKAAGCVWHGSTPLWWGCREFRGATKKQLDVTVTGKIIIGKCKLLYYYIRVRVSRPKNYWWRPLLLCYQGAAADVTYLCLHSVRMTADEDRHGMAGMVLDIMMTLIGRGRDNGDRYEAERTMPHGESARRRCGRAITLLYTTTAQLRRPCRLKKKKRIRFFFPAHRPGKFLYDKFCLKYVFAFLGFRVEGTRVGLCRPTTPWLPPPTRRSSLRLYLSCWC
jgi:hypothetical protein